jgi:Cu(I)/Ag(I) efflux system membrane protein CusA/SilA
MQRIAAPMIGGMVTATLLSLLVLPVIYSWVLIIQEKSTKTSTMKTISNIQTGS